MYTMTIGRALSLFTFTVNKLLDEYRMARKMLMAEVSGGLVRGRQRLARMDGVKVVLGNRGMTVEATKDRKESRAIVHMNLIEFHSAISA